MLRSARLPVAALVLLVALALPAAVAAKPSQLDPSFGESTPRGTTTVAADFGDEAWEAVRVGSASSASDGRIYLLVRNSILALRDDGRRAGVFGGGTPAAIDRGAIAVLDPSGEPLRLVGIAVDSLGRVLVAGTVGPGALLDPSASEIMGGPLARYAFVARFTSQGVPDPSFGEGGVVRTDFGLPKGAGKVSGETVQVPQVGLFGIAVDAEDRVVLSGYRVPGPVACRSSGRYDGTEPFLARLNVDGSPDAGFASGALGVPGIAAFGFEGEIGAPELDPEGGAYVLAGRGSPCQRHAVGEILGHFRPDGQLDAGFAAGGWKQLPRNRNSIGDVLAVDRDSRPLMLGWRGRGDAPYLNIALRLRSDGQPDDSFGDRGIATFPSGNPGQVELEGLTTSGGAAYAVGVWWPHGRDWRTREHADRAFFIGRLDARGRPDRRFGHGGWLATRLGSNSEAVGSSVLVEPDGTPVAAGTTASPSLPSGAGLGLAGYRWGR